MTSNQANSDEDRNSRTWAWEESHYSVRNSSCAYIYANRLVQSMTTRLTMIFLLNRQQLSLSSTKNN